MTEKFVHDRNDHTDKHERWHLTQKVWQQQTWTVEYDQNKKIKILSLRRPTYIGHILPFKFVVLMNLGHFKILVIFMGISVKFNHSCSSV